MTTNIILILGFLLLGFFVWYFSRDRAEKSEKTDEGSLLLIQNQLQNLSAILDKKLGETNKELRETMKSQFSESAKIIKDVTEGLVKLDETNKQVVSFADQLQSLQDILKNPKQRGVLGEYYLETVLKNVLPPGRFKMQYEFENGEIVDAVIFLEKDKILPIDSKFSLENYNRLIEEREPAEREKLEKQFKADLKNRIDETSKYIRPREGTMEFAFMFIPSEGIYYDLLINQVGAVKANTRDLIEYAFQQKKVIIVSPTSFMAYLQTVLQGLKALQIEEKALEIMKNVEKLGRHIKTHDIYMQKLGGSLGTTVNHFNRAYKELGKVDKDVLKITDESPGIEPEVLKEPEMES